MIHDILLLLMAPSSSKLPIEEFLISDSISSFMHPGEKKILEKIIEIIQKHREIARFTKEYGGNLKAHVLPYNPEDSLQKGVYLQAFSNGIEKTLEYYFEEITDLEKRYLQNPTHSLLFIYQKLSTFQPLFHFLQRLVRGVRSQKLHGCSILQYIHQNMLHGNVQISQAMRTVQSSVNIVFLKQLTNWILYGKIIDAYGEFFIQCAEVKNSSTESDHCTSPGSGQHTTGTGTIVTATLSETTSTYEDIWRYEIFYDFLPHYFTLNWAEKVLFIGQTVLMFKVDAYKTNRKVLLWKENEHNIYNNGSLWNGQEHVFFKKIHDLRDQALNISQYEKVIDEVKSYVTERLSQIAVNQADLIKQLKLIKDFYLLGRGELYLEYIKRTYNIGKSPVTENTVRDLLKAFDLAAHSVNLTDDLEQFSLNIPKENIELNEFENFGYLQHLTLEYKINWPLHLLFSPKVLERYNELFRFLLLVKKMQYELHMVWCKYRKMDKLKSVNTLELRNWLSFLIDNLQYYIQVDVLESQFSILMNTVQNSSDFEQIQRAHSIFQANVLSLCFLLTIDETALSTTSHSIVGGNYRKNSVIHPQENPVFTVLNKIFHICEDFCNLAISAEDITSRNVVEKANTMKEQLCSSIEHLMELLMKLKSAPSSTPLSQLLLRLNFNHWFSGHTQKEEECGDC